jgi:hypothetical protein
MGSSYTWRLERAVIQSQKVLSQAVKPGTLSDREALDSLIAILDDPDFLLLMNQAGVKRRTIPALRIPGGKPLTAKVVRAAAQGLSRSRIGAGD